MLLLTLASTLLLANSVAAHGGVLAYTIEGKKYTGYGVKSLQDQDRFTTTKPGSSIQRAWTEIRPVRNPSSKDIACNKPGAPAKISASVAAGRSVTAHWNSKAEGNPWPHAGGPITVYMTECKGDCSTWADPSEGEWFKIFQAGLLSGTVGHGKWGTNEMMANGFKVTTKIPPGLKPGNYLVRHETINLARAPAEFYPECAQLKVTGSGTESPGKEFRFKLPGAYKSSDSAIKYSMHDAPVTGSSKYVIPGPAVWKGSAGRSRVVAERTRGLYNFRSEEKNVTDTDVSTA
ncbi:putative glycoside hydrolase family 61 [Venturia nashicola]|uniref:AA9 family lytic polysaccharide monooxygenase n=1 Tax=Venturia nashicola TaxID=86259 RepID=A0A4Z1NNV2_9PEZI|nr:putative glycoside hydrolase family 61 [Venturia nashicola]